MKSIPEQPAFYKQYLEPTEFWSVGINKVENTEYILLIENHEQYEYPIDGWYYHATPPQAYIDWWNSIHPEDEEVTGELL